MSIYRPLSYPSRSLNANTLQYLEKKIIFLFCLGSYVAKRCKKWQFPVIEKEDRTTEYKNISSMDSKEPVLSFTEKKPCTESNYRQFPINIIKKS